MYNKKYTSEKIREIFETASFVGSTTKTLAPWFSDSLILDMVLFIMWFKLSNHLMFRPFFVIRQIMFVYFLSTCSCNIYTIKFYLLHGLKLAIILALF